MDATDLPDQRDVWEERLRRVRKSQARVDVRGMRRPPRDPDERAFLAQVGALGSFPEDPALPRPEVARRKKEGGAPQASVSSPHHQGCWRG